MKALREFWERARDAVEPLLAWSREVEHEDWDTPAKVKKIKGDSERPLTMPMARALHEHLGVPAAVLLQQPGADLDTEIETLEWDRFPIEAMAKVGWIPTVRMPKRAVAGAALYRKSHQARGNAKTDPSALKAWC